MNFEFEKFLESGKSVVNGMNFIENHLLQE